MERGARVSYGDESPVSRCSRSTSRRRRSVETRRNTALIGKKKPEKPMIKTGEKRKREGDPEKKNGKTNRTNEPNQTEPKQKKRATVMKVALLERCIPVTNLSGRRDPCFVVSTFFHPVRSPPSSFRSTQPISVRVASTGLTEPISGSVDFSSFLREEKTTIHQREREREK